VAKIELDHVALALPRLADAAPFLVGVLGGVPYMGADTPAYRFAQWRFANGARIEVLEPRGEASFLHRFLAGRGPGVHHVTFKVPDLREACARAEAHGYDVVGFDDSDEHWKEAFLHPRQAQGIVVQMAQASPGAGDVLRRRWTPPPSPPAPPPPVHVLGLRLRARSLARAATQWETVLGGEPVEASEGETVYRWPGCPLGLVVEEGADGEEGPVAIELGADRGLMLAPGTHRVLGARFVVVARV
jgi:catechol 2,3-dioxygenase-like lactoylglutathione lyase family enzyme